MVMAVVHGLVTECESAKGGRADVADGTLAQEGC